MTKSFNQLLSALLALFFILSLLAGNVNLAQASPIETWHDYIPAKLSSSTDNVTIQTDNITSKDDVNIIDVDKTTGKELRGESRIITLTPEQQAEIQKMIEQITKLEDPSEIRFVPSIYIIHVTAGTVDESILNNGKASANDYYVIQFYTDMASVDKDTRDTLHQIGCIFYHYVQTNAFCAKIPPQALDTVISLVKDGKVRYLGRIPTEAKISQKLLAEMKANPDKSFEIVVIFYDKADPSELDSLKSIMKVDYYSNVSHFISGTVLGNKIQNILDLSFVDWVEERTYGTVTNNDGTSAVGELQEYLVVLSTMTPEYENQILAINSVKYIGDTTFIGTNNVQYPVIVISSDRAAAEEIKMLDFVVAMSPVNSAPTVPIQPPSVETTKATVMRLVIIASVAAILALAIIMIFYLRKRHRSQA